MSDTTPSEQPTEQPTPPELRDPWSTQRAGGFRWFAFSGAFHLVLLFLLATVTLTVMQQEEERVSVMIDAVVEEQFTGFPSLRELAGGALNMQRAKRQRAAPAAPVVKDVRPTDLPRIGSIAPKLGSKATDVSDVPLSFGSGAVGGIGGSFGEYVGGLRKVGLDVAMVIDTTDSMQFVIDDVKAHLSWLVAAIQKMVPTSRVGIVVYRDSGDEYTVKWSDLSFHTDKLQAFLSTITADGGGDWEEAVKEGLEAAIHDLSWRKKSKRIVILVGGSPPHEWDVPDVLALARAFQEERGHISAIDVTRRQHLLFDRQMWRAVHGKKAYKPSPLPDFYKDVATSFAQIAKAGGGEMVLLDEEGEVLRSVLELTFGSRWRVELAPYIDDPSL